jgi:hypothetical protein
MKRKIKQISKIPNKRIKPLESAQFKIATEAESHLSGCPSNWLKEKIRCDCLKLKEDIFWSIY